MNPFPQDQAYLWFLTQSQSALQPHVSPSFPLPPYNPTNFLPRNAKHTPSINPFQQYMYPTPNPQDFLSAYNPYYYQSKLFPKPLDFPFPYAHLSKKDDAFSAETDMTDSLSPHSAGSQLFTKKEDLQPKIEAVRPVKEEEFPNVKLELSGAIPFKNRRPQDLLRRRQVGTMLKKEESPLEQEVRSQMGIVKKNEEEILNKIEAKNKENTVKAIIKKESPSSGLLKESKKISKLPKGSPESKDSSPTKPEKSRNKRRLWTSEEDASLLALIEKIGFRWTRIGRLIGGRSGNQVRDRYINNLRPGLSNLPWSEEEDQLLKTLYYILGSRWCCVVRYLPGRSEAQAKNRFYNEVKMQLKPEEEKVKVMKLIINWKNSLKNKRGFCKQEAFELKSPAVENFEEILERIYLQNENVYFHPSICFDNIPTQNDGSWDLNEGVFAPKP